MLVYAGIWCSYCGALPIERRPIGAVDHGDVPVNRTSVSKHGRQSSNQDTSSHPKGYA